MAVIVVKYGGNAMGAGGDDAIEDCAALHRAGRDVVLVHGGGPQIDGELRARGLGGRRLAGLRVTDAATLTVTEQILCATVNKALVRRFAALGVAAVGISGEDGALLGARPAPPVDGESLGFVGDVVAVRPAVIEALIDRRFLPVVAPLGIAPDGSSAFNVNADTAAGAIAGAVHAEAYVVITDVPRVKRDLDDPSSEIERLDVREARELLENGAFGGGMRPKMLAALDALARGAQRVIIAGDGPQAVARALAGSGTEILL